MAPQVFTVHGIRTTAPWQKSLGDLLAAAKFQPATFDYGNFGLPSYMWGPARERIVDEFRGFYEQQLKAYRAKSHRRATALPHAVAHSFGTFVVGMAMRKFADVKFDKVLLCGSILPVDFPWDTLIAGEQVQEVMNFYSERDVWPKLSSLVASGTGPSGARGFDTQSPLVRQVRHEFRRHSDYFAPADFAEHWLPYLKAASPSMHVLLGHAIADIKKYSALLNESHEIDLACYSGLPGFANVDLPRGLSVEWIKVNPEIYAFLMDAGGQMRGFLNAIPLAQAPFDAILAGKLRDNQVQAADIVPYVAGATVDLYLMAVAVDPESRHIGQGIRHAGLERLASAFLARLETLVRESKVTVNRLGAVGWTPEGRRLCELLSMKRHAVDEFGNPTYVLSMSDVTPQTRVPFSGLRRVAAAQGDH